MLRLLLKAGHSLETIATSNALRFVGSASLEALSGKKIHTDLFDDPASVPHIQLAKTDLVLVAPATASFIARYAYGLADDLLLNVLLATNALVVIAPAMHSEMWNHAATQQNVQTLRNRGVHVIEPVIGALTSGDFGVGRLADVHSIVTAISELGGLDSAPGHSVVVTAGGTRERIDDVRFIGNASTGRQGVSLAFALSRQGYKVTLIGANMTDPNIESVSFQSVESHADMAKAMRSTPCEILIMAAAVSDFKVTPVEGKIRRSGVVNLELTPTEDLVKAYKSENPDTTVVAFAAEPASGEELISAARQKLQRKGADAVIANPISAVGSDWNEGYVTVMEQAIQFKGHKAQVSEQIISALQLLNVLPKN